MIRNILLITILFFGVASGFSQRTHDHDHSEGFAEKYCSASEAEERFKKNNPELIPLIEAAEAKLELFTANFSTADLQRSGSNYIIPVVFHIVHANGSENISDAQVHDAMNILTEDFTLANDDADFVVSEFADLVANVGVEFRLARLDPNGDCTNGIIRTVSSNTFEGGENLKSISPGWPRESYLNVWVAADLSSGAAGYTYTPGSVDGPWGSDADGIVIKHTYVGSIGTGSPGRSRALTHEVGHWINLRHPWGGTNDPGLPENCNSDDNVSDTPNTIGWTSCSLGGESCGSLDNVQNFMEYSYCSRMFTEGQKTRMIAALNSSTASRNNLHTTSNLLATGVIGPVDLCRVEMTSNKSFICEGDSIVYTDQSYHGVTNRTWTFEGGTPATSTGEEVVVYYNESGTYDVSLEIENSSGESISETFENTVKVWTAEGESLDYSEDFEGGVDLDEDWQIINTGTTHEWEVSEDVSGASGSQALMLPNRSLDEGDESEIWSKPIDLSSTNTDVTITFKYAYARRNPGNNERLMFWVSSNCGETWSLKEILTNDFATAPFTNAFWLPTNSSQWETVVIDNISESQLVSNFRFKFVFESDGGNNFFIDDINITGPDATSIISHDISNSISVFPNPAHNQTQLLITGSEAYTFDLRLMNTLGQAVLSQEHFHFGGGSQQYELHTGNLSPGIYMLYIDTEKGEQAVKKIVIAAQ